MAISVLQRKTGADATGASGQTSIAFGSNTTAGNTIIVACVMGDTTQVLFNKEQRPPTDSQSNKYYLLNNAGYSSAAGLRWYAAYNIAGGATTVTSKDNSNAAIMFIFEVAGLASYAAFDLAAFGTDTSTTSYTSGTTGTTSYANELLLATFFGARTANTFSAGSGYSNAQTGTGASGIPGNAGTEEQIVSATGTYQATATASLSDSGFGSIITLADTAAVTKLVTITNAGTTYNTTTGTHTVVATPALNDLIVIVWSNSAFATDPTISDNNSGGAGTYTKIVTALKNTSADNLGIAIRTALIGSATSTTFSVTGASSTGGGLTVYRVSGMSKVGAAAALQSAAQANQAANTTPAPAFTNNVTSPNAVIAAVFNTTNSTTVGTHPPVGFVQGQFNAYTTTANSMLSAFSEGGPTGKTMTFDAQSQSVWSSVAVELDTSGGSASASITQVAASVTAAGGTQVVAAVMQPYVYRPLVVNQAVNRSGTY